MIEPGVDQQHVVMAFLEHPVGPDDDVLALAELELSPGKHHEAIFQERLAILVHVEYRRIHALHDDRGLLESVRAQDVQAPRGTGDHQVEVPAGIVEAGTWEHRMLNERVAHVARTPDLRGHGQKLGPVDRLEHGTPGGSKARRISVGVNAPQLNILKLIADIPGLERAGDQAHRGQSGQFPRQVLAANSPAVRITQRQGKG
jgi:hypothetical protein